MTKTVRCKSRRILTPSPVVMRCAAALFVSLCCHVCIAGAPTASMVNRFGTDAGGSCTSPCPFIGYTVSTSPHQYTASDGGVGIRTAEGSLALTYDHGDKTISGALDGICWETIDLAGGTDWSAESVADADAYWYEGTLLHGEPIAVKINGTVAQRGTCGALTSRTFAWCNVLSTEGSGVNEFKLYVQTHDDNNPEIKTATYIRPVYGDGTHVQLSSAAGGIALSWWELDNVDVDLGIAELVEDLHATDDLADVLMSQCVKDIWTDLTYTWAVSANSVEDAIVDPRTTALAPETDEHSGRGPEFAAALKDWSSATVTMTVTDLANTGSDDSAVVITELSWSPSTDFYVDPTLGEDGEALGTHQGAGWTASIADASAYYYNATVTAGKPDRVLINVGGGTSTTNVTLLTEGTCGTLTSNQWCYGKIDGQLTDRVYVQTTSGVNVHAEWSSGSITEPFASWNYGVNRLRGVPSGNRRLFIKCGETVSIGSGVNAAQWGAETLPTYVGAYGTCTGSNNPIISKAGGIIWNIAENNSPYTRDIVVEDVTFTQTAGSSNILVINGKNSLWSGIEINYAGTGTAIQRGAGDYSWSLWWDWDAHVTNSSCLYGLVDSNPVHGSGREIKGVAFVGVDWDHQGGTSTSAPFRTNHHAATMFKNCKVLRNNVAANPVLRINLSTGVYLNDNYLIGQGASTTMTNGCGGSCGPGTSTSWLIDGDLWDLTGASGSPTHFDFDINPDSTSTPERTTPEGAFRIQNTIAVGGNAFVGMHFFRAPDFRVYNSTFYTENIGEKELFKFNASNGSVACLKVYNVAMEATDDDASTFFVEQSALYGTLEGTNLDHNTCDIGASANFVITESVTYADPTAWAAAAGKSHQDANEWDTDPLFVDAGADNFRPDTGSPLIGTGKIIPTNPKAHDGSAWSSPPDRGALPAISATTGRCYACSGVCTNGQTQAECDAIMGDWDEGLSCAGDASTGACCTVAEGQFSVITDFCCAATQWISGGVKADCLWECCEDDGGCVNRTAAACDALTNEVYTWGTSCSGDCETLACCNGVSCSDLTLFACDALGRTNAGPGSDCGTGSPCAGPTSGSCCDIFGGCSVTTSDACPAPNVWDDGGSCDPNLCAPAGSCCLDDESCETETEVACLAEVGTGLWGGPATSCTAGLCDLHACCNGLSCTDTIVDACDFTIKFGLECADSPCASGACVTPGSCQTLHEAGCTAIGGTYMGDGSLCGRGMFILLP